MQPWVDRFDLLKNQLEHEKDKGIITPEEYESTLKEWNISFGRDCKNIFEIIFPYFPSIRIDELKQEFERETKRIYDAFVPILEMQGPSTTFDTVVGETIQFYIRRSRRFKFTQDYWKTIKRYKKIEHLQNVLTNTTPVIYIRFNKNGNVSQWYLKKSRQSKKRIHTEKHLTKFYLGPETAEEWPGEGLKRDYDCTTKEDYNFVVNDLLCSVEGALAAIRFNTPIPEYTKVEHYNEIVKKWAIFHNWLMQNAKGLLDAESAKQLILDIIGFPKYIKDRDRFRNRLSHSRTTRKQTY